MTMTYGPRSGVMRAGVLSLWWVLGVAVVPALSGTETGDRAVLAQLEAPASRDVAIQRALAFLRTQQTAAGAFGERFPTANTALALMAHFAAGHTPHDLAHASAINAGIDAVLLAQTPGGYFGRADNSRMYGHGITTLMLAEALGMMLDEEREEAVRAALERAVAVTVAAAMVPKRAQHRGGWRYQPNDQGSDLSLSGWQLMSLHACAQVGIDVPEGVIVDAVAYARRLTSPDGRVGYEGLGQDHPGLRGAALLSFAIGGHQDAPEVARIVDRIVRQPIAWQGGWLFYRAYYDAVGLSRAAPVEWAVYAATLENVLIDHQAEDGSWPTSPGDNEGGNGVVYRTAMATLALAVGKQVLPAYQR